MARTTPNIDEDRLLGVPCGCFTLQRVDIEPCGHANSLGSHKFGEMLEPDRMLLYPKECRQICVEGLIEGCLGVVGQVLILPFRQNRRKFLICRSCRVEPATLILSFCNQKSRLGSEQRESRAYNVHAQPCLKHDLLTYARCLTGFLRLPTLW